jgi:TolA-binding protein
MFFFRCCPVIFALLVLGGGPVMAASREERAFAAASVDFQSEMWGRAETGFDQFAKNFHRSTNAPLAVLLKAQAQFRQKKFSTAIATLNAGQPAAGALADQYADWVAEAEFAAGDFPAAADAFEALVKNFPDSSLRLRAVVGAAAALEKKQDWARLSALLGDAGGLFAKKAELDAANEIVVRGRLLLAHAEFEQKDFSGASAQLALVRPEALTTDLQWQRQFLIGQTRLAVGDLDAALAAAASLAQLAQLEKDGRHRAESAALRGEILEKTGRLDESAAAWQENLAAGTPEEKQREAIWKIAALSLAQGRFTEAESTLENFIRQFPDAPAAETAQLSLGELRLKAAVTAGDTNRLAPAREAFDAVLKKFPDGALAGRALLDRGWCAWLAGSLPEALADFRSALRRNLAPEEQAVAKFKAGDVLFAQKDFRGALENYSGISTADKNLSGLALHQGLRANLELGDPAAAGRLFENLFQNFSGSELGQGSALLYGESLVKAADARALFERLAPQFAGGPLEPQLRLARARTFESDQAWPDAVTGYESWLKDFSTNALRPQVEFALAQAKFHAGDEPAALARFTRFVAEFPADASAPIAQWWIAEHFFRAGEFKDAEMNYEAVFQNPAWKSSPLFYPAQIMAGRAAMGRTGFKDAADYFMRIIADTNCTDAALGVQARFACGAALMHMDSGATNTAALQTATNLFAQIIQKNPTNDLAARAWGETGDCALQMNDGAAATNAYARAFGAASAGDVSIRSRAQVGCGLALEKLAESAYGVDQDELLKRARDLYLEICYRQNLRDGEAADLFWVKKAGLQAAPLVGRFDGVRAQKIFYLNLQATLPALASAIQKKLGALPPEKND